MQRLVFVLLICFVTQLTTAAIKADSLNKTITINMLDTVVFDLSRADTVLNRVEFPVYILSNDTVNALDFSFKYNETDFMYDSIIDLTNYLQTFSYYNPLDSTLRFTSNSFQRYENDSELVAIRFNVISGQFCVNDLRTIKVYLNGDMCSYKIIDCLHVGIAAINKNNDQLTIYPNPANEKLILAFPKNAQLELVQADGRIVIQSHIFAGQTKELLISHLTNGVYLLRVFNEQFISSKKISIQH